MFKLSPCVHRAPLQASLPPSHPPQHSAPNRRLPGDGLCARSHPAQTRQPSLQNHARPLFEQQRHAALVAIARRRTTTDVRRQRLVRRIRCAHRPHDDDDDDGSSSAQPSPSSVGDVCTSCKSARWPQRRRRRRRWGGQLHLGAEPTCTQHERGGVVVLSRHRTMHAHDVPTLIETRNDTSSHKCVGFSLRERCEIVFFGGVCDLCTVHDT